jgi:uncharacterized protein with NRDE domain
MCLLAVSFRAHPDAPLIVAANRDELLARPTTPLALLEVGPPRIMGGKDLVAGGTWLAVNAYGVIAGLTNLPGPRDGGKRSRGELPLVLARKDSAPAAVRELVAQVTPRAYNPAWLLCGDRNALFYVDLTGDTALATPLAPGLHVLENRPLGVPSPKAALVHARLAQAMTLRGAAMRSALERLLASHDVPEEPAEPGRPPATLAACVHAGPYGTRSSSIVIVPAGPAPPRIRVADGPPCTTAFVDAAIAWAE